MRISNEDRSPARIHGCDAAPTPTGFAEIVGDARIVDGRRVNWLSGIPLAALHGFPFVRAVA
jgi:hypothetical protein